MNTLQPTIALLAAFSLTACNRSNAPEKTLMDAAWEGDLQTVQLHIDAGTNLDRRAPDSGATPLIKAVTMGHIDVARLLIEAEADLEVGNNDGSTALHTAAFLCRKEIVRMLLDAGADRLATNNQGSTALLSVEIPFEEVKPIYDLIMAILGPLGLQLDYGYIEATRPEIAQMLRSHP